LIIEILKLMIKLHIPAKYVLLLHLVIILFSCGNRRKLNRGDNILIPNQSISETIDLQEKIVFERAEPDASKMPTKNPILSAEIEADSIGGSILKQGRMMALEEKTIFQGSCWDYINEVFNRAGFGSNRKTVFRSSQSGPYASITDIAPGDWIYHINYGYGSVHSGIFVYWDDEERMIGTTLSHPGENRNSPGRYRSYDLSGVYQVIRPVKK